MHRWIRRPEPSPDLGTLARTIGGTLENVPGSLPLESIGPADASRPCTLAPLWDPRRIRRGGACRARILLIPEAIAADVARGKFGPGTGFWIHPRPRRALREILHALYAPADPFDGVRPGPSPGSWVHPGAAIEAGTTLGPGVLVAVGARVEPGCSIGAGAIVLHDVRVGRGTEIGPGCVLGAEGFGLDAAEGELDPSPIPHVGGLRSGANAGLGAHVTVARGTLGDTVIGDGCRLDAQVQVGHNVRLGRGCVLCAQVGIGGSARIGDGAWIGGQAGVADHARVGAHARVAAQSGVIGDVPAGAVYGGTPAVPHRTWMRGAAILGRLARPRAGETR
jgi:UDP-3-O-[3-hydroxymyristoyl] glucosamine N-acyltransferase